MPPQIKQDLNRSGWETTDFPSVCESCLPENPYVQMLKEDHGAECKVSLIYVILTFIVTILTKGEALHSAIYCLPLEGRPDCPRQTHKYLPHMCTAQELLSMLYVGLIIRPSNRCTRCGIENASPRSGQ